MTNYIRNNSGQRLVQHEWTIENSRARLLIVHGYAEHGNRYGHLAAFLNEKNIDVISYDHRGHGKSDGTRAYVDTFNDYIDDLELILDMMGKEKPIFLFGHSMGGLIAVRYCQQKHTNILTGLITSGAALKLDDDLSPILLKIVPFLSWLFPKLPLQKLDKTYLTRSAEVKEAYLNDPLVYLGGTRARTGAEMIKAIDEANNDFEQINIPFLAMHGGADKLTDPEGTRKFHENASSTDKSLKIWEGLYHELINEPEAKEVMRYIGDWLEKHLE